MEPRPDLSRLVAAPLAAKGIGEPGNQFAIVEWSDSGEGDWEWIAPLHVHHADDEAWYVLEGSLRFRLGDDEVRAEAGSAVLAPRGTPHAYGNAGDGPARYLLITTPRILELVEALHKPPGNGPSHYAAIFRQYDSELLTG